MIIIRQCLCRLPRLMPLLLSTSIACGLPEEPEIPDTVSGVFDLYSIADDSLPFGCMSSIDPPFDNGYILASSISIPRGADSARITHLILTDPACEGSLLPPPDTLTFDRMHAIQITANTVLIEGFRCHPQTLVCEPEPYYDEGHITAMGQELWIRRTYGRLGGLGGTWHKYARRED